MQAFALMTSFAVLAALTHAPEASCDMRSVPALADCGCAADISVSTLPTGLSVTVVQGAQGDCTPHCNDVPNCEGNAINCCPTPGTATVRVTDWTGFGGDLTIYLNGVQQGSITHGSSASLGNLTVGGNSVLCSGTADHTESKGDSLRIDVAGGGQYFITIKDVCKKCPG